MRGISFYFTIFSSPCKEHSWGAWGRPWFARIPRLAHFSQWNPSSRRSAPRGRNVVVEAAWVGASYWFKKVNAQFIEKKRRLYNDVQCNVHTVCNWLLPWHSSRTASSSLSLWFGSSSSDASVEESFRRSLQQLASLAWETWENDQIKSKLGTITFAQWRSHFFNMNLSASFSFSFGAICDCSSQAQNTDLGKTTTKMGKSYTLTF